MDANKKTKPGIQAALWAALIVLLLLTAWTLQVAISAPTSVNAPALPQGKDGFPKTIRLPGGVSVTIPAFPRRIVPANSGAADILSGLIDPERFAAVPVQVEQFAAATDFWSKHKNIPHIEKYQAEPILGAHPDLVVSSAFQDGNTTAAIARQGIPILSFEAFETFDGIRAAILTLGVAVGEEARAEKLAAHFDSRLKEVDIRTSAKKHPRVLMYSNYGSGFTVGAGGSQDEILTRAGAKNAAAEIGLKGPAPITFEQMLKLDPEVLVVCGDKGLDSPQIKLVSSEPALANLSAIRNKRFAVIPSRLFDALSQHVVEAVTTLAAQLHPHAFGADEQAERSPQK